MCYYKLRLFLQNSDSITLLQKHKDLRLGNHRLFTQGLVHSDNISVQRVRSMAIDSMTCASIHLQSWHLYANFILCSKDNQIQS